MTDMITELAHRVAQDARFQAAIADALAVVLAEHMRAEFGGDRIYISKKAGQSLAERDAAIRSAFNGTNYAMLAREHSITPRQVRRILNRQGCADAHE